MTPVEVLLLCSFLLCIFERLCIELFCFAERGFFIPKLFISCGVRLDKLLKPCLDPFVCRAQSLRRKLKNRFLHIVGTFVANGCVGGNGKGHCCFVRAVPPAKILSAAGINVVGARL